MSVIRHLPRLRRPQLSYANIASTAALVITLGTGTAYAANTVFSTDIVDGEVKNPDLATNAVNTGKILNGGVWAQDIKLGDLTGDQVADGSLGSADLGPSSVGQNQIQTDGVGATEVQDDSIDGGELVNESIGSADLAPGSVGTSEVSDGSLTGTDVANDGLTMSDIAGGGTNGSVSFSSLSNGRCYEVSLNISGATAGDAIVVTTKGDMPDGVFLYGTQVVSATSAKAVICNLSGATSPAISGMPVRIVTFH